MAYRCPTAKPIGNAKLEGYQLLFRGGQRNAVATIEKSKGFGVPVLLWEITPSDEAALDRYEAFPHLYGKKMMKVTFGEKLQKVMVYTMNEGRALGSPSQYYYDVIKHGYRSAGFDLEILKQAVKYSIEG